MALSGDTGNGATLTLPGSYSVAIISIDPGAETLESLDVSTLATTSVHDMMPSDLKKVGECTVKFKWVSTTAAPTLGTVGTCTITLPTWQSLTNAPTYSGTGYLTSWKPPTLENGKLMDGELKFQFDGDTGPTYTIAS